MANDIEVLQAAIELRHDCKAFHAGSIQLKKQVVGQNGWEGIVELFELSRHKTANWCYAWAGFPQGTKRQVVTVLQARLVISPERAVKGWLATAPARINPPDPSALRSRQASETEEPLEQRIRRTKQMLMESEAKISALACSIRDNEELLRKVAGRNGQVESA